LTNEGSLWCSIAGVGDEYVKDLVAGSGLRFQDQGAYELKGIPDTWRLYAVDS